VRINNDLRIKIASMISCTCDLYVAMEIKYDNTQFDAFLFADDRTVTFSIVTNLLENIGHLTMKCKYQKNSSDVRFELITRA